MKIRIDFHPKSALLLPHSYQHVLQGFFYSLMEREKAKNIHDSSSFKFFCFSMIEGRYQLNKAEHTISFFESCSVFFSAIDTDLILKMVFQLGKRTRLELSGQEIIIDRITFVEKPLTQQEIYRIRLLSPVSVHQTVEVAGKNKTLYFSPADIDFQPLLKQNFIRKYEAYHKTGLTDDITFEIQPIREPRIANIRYKDFTIIGYLGDFYLRCEKEYLDFLLDVGLGDRNSFGFGMFEVLC